MSFANLIAKKKAQQNEQPSVVNPAESTAGNDGDGARSSTQGSGSDISESSTVHGEQATAPAPTKAGGAVRFGVKTGGDRGKPAGVSSDGAGSPATGVAKRFAAFGAGGSAAGVSESRVRAEPEPELHDRAIDSVAALADSTAGQALERKPSLFADEVAADAPPRNLEGLDQQQQTFIKSLDSVYEVLHEPEMLGKVIRSIMLELSENPEYRKLISPLDVRTMIKGMRDAMGMARVKKQEKKRGSGSRAAPSKAIDMDMLADLDALGDLE